MPAIHKRRDASGRCHTNTWSPKYEITIAQYVEFLNAVADTDPNELYHPNMGFGFSITRSGSPGSYQYSADAGRATLPVSLVSFYSALRFANWLHNNKPNTGAQTNETTEDGAYTFSAIDVVGPRNPGARAAIPTEDEWYKAAYYDSCLGRVL